MNPENRAVPSTVQQQEYASGRSFHSPKPIREHSTRDDAILLASFASIASEKSSSSREVSPVATSKNSAANKNNSSSLLLSRTFPALPVLNPVKGMVQDTVLAAGTVENVTDEQSRPRAISYASHEVPIRSAATLLQLQPSSSAPQMTRVPHERPLAPKATPVPKTHIEATSIEKPPTVILRKKFSWKHYPPLEDFLIANREEYLRFSTMNYTIQQKKYNNTLTEQMIALAQSQGYIFDSQDFSFVTVRDRIRCYYKSYVQSLKKRGIVVGYAARKLGMISEQDMKECAKLKAKIYVPRK
ncbi:hypothetical protein CTEN210_00830 [Chaetoceros tenuissimus]|uniref:Uncharacterized protein n=1 Tax=Chaetoceros tenuissimus TaxID=426638 RepID=A0AAD3GZ54_9STRA|nr:hypothetical protein CTEN210_00830 [Chaetoceros tenuissimus]